MPASPTVAPSEGENGFKKDKINCYLRVYIYIYITQRK